MNQIKKRGSRKFFNKRNNNQRKNNNTKSIRYKNNNFDNVQYIRNMESNLQLIDNKVDILYNMNLKYLSYLKNIYISPETKNFEVPDKVQSSLYQKDRAIIKHELTITQGNDIELLLNFDFLFTKNFSVLLGENNSRFSIGFLVNAGKVYDLLVDSVDIEAIKYKNIGTAIKSQISQGTKFLLSYITLDAIPIIKLGNDQVQVQQVSTDIRNLSILDQLSNTGLEHTQEDQLDVSFLPKLNTFDFIGFLNGKSPIIQGIKESDFINSYKQNFYSSAKTKQQLEQTYNLPLVVLDSIFKLYTIAHEHPNSILKCRATYLRVTIPKLSSDLTITFNTMYEYLLKNDTTINTNARFTASQEDTRICIILRRIRQIFFYKNVKEILLILSNDKPSYYEQLSKRQTFYINKIVKNKTLIFKLIKVLKVIKSGLTLLIFPFVTLSKS
jgi:hypothetical protein